MWIKDISVYYQYILSMLRKLDPRLVTQTVLNWNQLLASLRQWKSIIQPEANHSSYLTTTGY